MNRRFLTAFYFAVALTGVGAGLSSCSSDDLTVENVVPSSNEQVYNVKIQASDSPLKEDAATRAIFVEEDSEKGDNYYTWEAADKLVVFAGKKKLGTPTILSGDAGKEVANFEGQLKATPEEIAGALKFVYLGGNAIISDTEAESKVSIDLSKQSGKVDGIAESSILLGEGYLKAKTEGGNDYITAGSSVKLSNPMAVFHLKVHPPKEIGKANVTALKISGEGVYSSVNIDLETGKAVGVLYAEGYKWEVPNNNKSNDNTYDFYYVLAPGKFTPNFYIYDDNAANKVGDWLGKEPGITYYTSEQALIRSTEGKISTFTARDPWEFPGGNKKEPVVFQFTRGNLQYVLGQRVGYMGGMSLTAVRNTLTRYDNSKGSAIPVPTKYRVDVPGEYRLAQNQWDIVHPVADQLFPLVQSGNYYYYMGRGSDQVIDLFGWGNVKHPDLAKKVGDYYSNLQHHKDIKYVNTYFDYKGNPYTDYGQKIYIDGQPATTPSVNELICIMTQRTFDNDGKYIMSTRAWIDMDGDKKWSRPADIGGVVVFPDGMTKADADKCWASIHETNEYELAANGYGLQFGPWASNTSEQANRLDPNAIAKYGLLFLPMAGSVDMKRSDNQWNMTESYYHANYLCSDWQKSAPSRYCKSGRYPKQGSTTYKAIGLLNTVKYTHTDDNGYTDLNGWLGGRLAVIKK